MIAVNYLLIFFVEFLFAGELSISNIYYFNEFYNYFGSAKAIFLMFLTPVVILSFEILIKLIIQALLINS